MVELKLLELPEKDFNEILNLFPGKVQKVNNIYDYFCGSPGNKKPIFTDGNEWIVCQEYIVDYVSNCIEGCTTWKQIRVRKNVTLNKPQKTYNGSYCYNYIMKIVKKYYSEDDIVDIMNKHSYEKTDSSDDKQFHYYYNCKQYEITKLKNCYKYDINGAHAFAVFNLFPKAKEDLQKLYNKKDEYKAKGNIEESNKIKALFNYFVGELCNKGYRNTYNYIIKKVTDVLVQVMKITDGQLVYANTDGFVVSNPKKLLPPSNEIGMFKLEGSGDMYVYKDKNYWLLEYTNSKGSVEHVGSCKLEVRKYISLANGDIVHYDNVREYIGKDSRGNDHFTVKVENIIKENLYGL